MNLIVAHPTPGQRAQAQQLVASDPAVSAFVSASAGSGKTKLLTDRLLRLMLAGADPARIQCLTYTKAGAAEMAIRLRRTLAQWVTLDEATLSDRLAALRVEPDHAARAAARALFARVLDLPGGMRIGTIHSFCQSLLRRFPLEARLSPHFRVADEVESGSVLRAAQEEMLAGAHDPERAQALMAAAGSVNAKQFAALIHALMGDRQRLAAFLALPPDELAALQRRSLLATVGEAELLADAVAWPREAAVLAALRDIAERGAPTVVVAARLRLDWLGREPAGRAAQWRDWTGSFVTGKDEPYKPDSLVNAKLARLAPHLLSILLEEQDRATVIEHRRRGAKHAAISAAILALGMPVARRYATAKAASGQLDYADLVTRSLELLADPGAAWVLFKLDGGLDHLLLDEVQDTAQEQWTIAAALVTEFFAGAGAHEARDAAALPRTMFAVGDPKQSIFSFQGANPAAFAHWRVVFEGHVRNAGHGWASAELDVSFRSTAPVLALVDAVFSHPDAAKGVTEDQLEHRAHRSGHAGRVELWPLTPPALESPLEPWVVPAEPQHRASATQRLAEHLADWIRDQTSGAVPLASQGRPLRPGDVLVLVRRRNALPRALVRALKQRGVPVAGLDRMQLTQQPAVADLLALCDALLLPEDDLALACLLTSPLGGLDDDSLQALAAGRRQARLIEALRARHRERPEWARAFAFFSDLLACVDFIPPHALLNQALGPLGGRARLLARFGADATEPLDELLSTALGYASAHPPSLQGFVHWLRQSAADVKREPEGAGNAVRIMTVHGSKGLQAPMVILPDTNAEPKCDDPWLWDMVGETCVPIWQPQGALRTEPSRRMQAALREAATQEYNRLLYVALTRAEDRLVICGAQPRKLSDTCWYSLVSGGFSLLGATPEPFAGPWGGEALVWESAQMVPPVTQATEASQLAQPMPGWTRPGAGALPHEPAVPVRLAPSRPADALLGPVPAADSPLAGRDAGGARFRRGQVLHALLQYLPALPVAARQGAAARHLAQAGLGLDADAAAATLREVFAVIDHPALAPLFGPDSRAEVPLTGLVGGRVIAGVVDRLVVLADRVLVADYKTNRLPPEDAAAIPVLYLRQMVAYRAVLRGAFPGRAVECALVWTIGAQVMPLAAATLDGHA